ncbi:MAG: 4-alpha-glucanotransferase [Chitinispirillaceae bacterium]|nr:4-alpha-glucanotransferase [Chitinispirillaceae bacterium]
MKRGYGILMPVFSLPSRHGIGDFGPAAFSFADLLADHGVAYWQILPLNRGTPENGDSPYFSGSAFAINPLLLSLDLLAAYGLISKDEVEALPVFPKEKIDYDELRRIKQPLLEKAARRFTDTPAYEQFCRAQSGWLDDFALFDVLRDERGRPWTDWDAPLRDRDPDAIRACTGIYGDEIRIRKVLQFLCFVQWSSLRRHCAEKNIRIIGDMPIYVALDSTDTWSHPELFKLDDGRRPAAVSGVPPDFFSATGQLWNNPVYKWETHAASGFSWWTGRLRHLFTLYDMVRIDHFRGLVQYWEIPAGESTAVNGSWQDVPTRDFFDTLTAEITPFPVIAEDLGIITDDVRAFMKQYGFPGMKILQFAFSDDDPQNAYLPHMYDENCLAYTGTHDNMPTLGWLQSVASDRERERIAMYIKHASSSRETVWDLIEQAMASRAAVAVLPMQDVLTLGPQARINDPASLHGNWRWRWNPDTDPAQAAFSRLADLGKKHGRVQNVE